MAQDVNYPCRWRVYLKRGNREVGYWHYGVAIREYTSSDPEGPCVEIEYTHSVPTLPNSGGSRSGRIVKVYGVHKVERLER